MSSQNRAIIIDSPGKASIHACSEPTLRPDYLLIRTTALALNPTDWKHIDYLATPNARVGCDYAGTIIAIGDAVTKQFKVGDSVAGFAHGGNAVYTDDGAFGNVITAKGDIQMKIPEGMSNIEASTLGVGITTVGQGLYQSLGLPLPDKPAKEKFPVLIYGGSTATGALAIQFAKLSGLEPIVTCSSHNFSYCEELGAAKCFDYKDEKCAENIKSYTKDGLKYVFDCISEGASTQISVGAMSSSGGTYSTLLPVDASKVSSINDKVEMKSTLGYTVVGEFFTFGGKEIPAKPEDFEFGKMFWEMAAGLLGSGKVKVHRPEVDQGGKGLEGAMKGLQMLREGKVSGKKLVYTM